MGMGDPSDDELEKEDATGRPEADQGEGGERGVDKASHFRRYMRMRICGFKWKKAEYECPRGRLADYNIGRAPFYSGRLASFSGRP